MLLTFLAAIAEFERELIRERVIAGLERARSEGRRLGRPRRCFDYPKAMAMRQAGASYVAISRALDVPATTVRRYLGKGRT